MKRRLMGVTHRVDLHREDDYPDCPQHITPRFTQAELEAKTGSLHEQIAQLRAEVQRLRLARDA